MISLTYRQVLALHGAVVCRSGGAGGVRDAGLLESALAAPFQSFAGQDVHAGVEAKAARLGWGIVRNHPFVDGNKRTGMHVMLVFLALNGVELDYGQDELVALALSIAGGEVGCGEVCAWVVEHER